MEVEIEGEKEIEVERELEERGVGHRTSLDLEGERDETGKKRSKEEKKVEEMG